MKTLLKMLKHKAIVTKNFRNFIAKLEEREAMHDVSKFNQDEFDGFAELDSDEVFKLYGTDEYKKLIADNIGIKLHYQRNRHHPEYHKDGSEGVTGFNLMSKMSFLDILEMVIDWKSASETYGTSFKESVQYSIKRFECDSYQKWLIELIAKEIE